MSKNTCGICTVHMLAYTYSLQVSGLIIVLHVFSVYTDDYFQPCKIPDLKIAWSQVPLVHNVRHRNSIPFFLDVVFKCPIYKRYQPLVGFLFPSSLTVQFWLSLCAVPYTFSKYLSNLPISFSEAVTFQVELYETQMNTVRLRDMA